jgi:hypothetical protein
MLQAGTLAISLALIALAASSCGGGDERPSSSTQGSNVANRVDAAALTPLYERLLNLKFSVEVVRGSDLSVIQLISSPGERRRKNLPRTVRPSIALRTDLRGNANAFVYRFQSAKLAEAAAPSLLGYWGDGVQGCGRTVFFTRRERHGYHGYRAWSAEVMSFLRHRGECKGHEFGVIS